MIGLREATDSLRAALPSVPEVAVVLGSGLAALENELTDRVSVSFHDVPGLPGTSVAGHSGRFVYGRLRGTEVLLQAGRIHAYEGHAQDIVVAPVRILSGLGVGTVLMTNAVGAIHPLMGPGDIVLIADQINSSFRSPLLGPIVGDEPRFPDMSAPFDTDLSALVRRVASDLSIEVKEGTYAGVLGPAYETAAEIRMLARLGGDVVGMSTVPEVIAAHALGLRFVVLSLVTNRATGLSRDRISHEDVLAMGRAAGERMVRLVADVVGTLGVDERLSQSMGAK